jgi:hypothetical protein
MRNNVNAVSKRVRIRKVDEKPVRNTGSQPFPDFGEMPGYMGNTTSASSLVYSTATPAVVLATQMDPNAFFEPAPQVQSSQAPKRRVRKSKGADKTAHPR